MSSSWIATIFTAQGRVATRINAKGDEEDLIKGFNLSQEADRWCARRLFEGEPDWYAEVASTRMTNSQGLPFKTRVSRSDAFAQILKTPTGPVCQAPPKPTGRLSFGVKNGKTTRVEFSRG